MVIATLIAYVLSTDSHIPCTADEWTSMLSPSKLKGADGLPVSSTDTVLKIGGPPQQYAAGMVDIAASSPWIAELSYKTVGADKGAALITISTSSSSFGIYASGTSMSLTRDGVVIQKVEQSDDWHRVSLANLPGYLTLALDNRIVAAWGEQHAFRQIEIGSKTPSSEIKTISIKDFSVSAASAAKETLKYPEYLPYGRALGASSLAGPTPQDIQQKFSPFKYDSRANRLALGMLHGFVRLTTDQSIALVPPISKILKDKYQQDLGLSITAALDGQKISDEIFSPTERASLIVPLNLVASSRVSDQARVYVHRNQSLTGDLIQDITFYWDKEAQIDSPKFDGERLSVHAQPSCTEIAVFQGSRCLGSISPVNGVASFSTRFLLSGTQTITFIPVRKEGDIFQPLSTTITIPPRIVASVEEVQSKSNSDSTTNWMAVHVEPTKAKTFSALRVFVNGHLFRTVSPEATEFVLGTTHLPQGIQFVSIQPLGLDGSEYASELLDGVQLTNPGPQLSRNQLSEQASQTLQDVMQLDDQIEQLQSAAKADPTFSRFQHLGLVDPRVPKNPTYRESGAASAPGSFPNEGTTQIPGPFPGEFPGRQVSRSSSGTSRFVGKSMSTRDIDAYVLSGRSAELFAESRRLVVQKAARLIEFAQCEFGLQLNSEARQAVKSAIVLTDDPQIVRMANQLLEEIR